MKTFEEYREDASNWITMADGEFYPDILADACELYKPVLILFGQLLSKSETSEVLMQKESISPDNIRVVTLRMINERITENWLKC